MGTVMELDFEEFWAQHDVAPSLCQVALSKPPANFVLLELHLQLATVLHMIAFFDLKISNVTSTYFDPAVSVGM